MTAKSSYSDSATRLQEIKALMDQVLEVERDIANLKEIQKEKKERRESLLLQIKEVVYDPQARLELGGAD